MHGESDEATLGPFRPADGVHFPDQYQGSGFAEPRFLVRLGDGQVIDLPRLPYLVTVGIAEVASAEGGVADAEQVAAWVSAQAGRDVSAANVRYLATGKLSRLGVVKAGSPGRPPRVRTSRPRRRMVVLGALGVLAATGVAAGVVAVTRPGSAPAPTPAAVANQAQAAAWVALQVSPGTMVSCDPATCGQLRRSGFPATRLMTLSPATPDPLGSAVVVATPAVRSQFGAQLASVYAPLVIAGFGSGANRVEVRAVAPDGPAAFETELRAQHASLSLAGQQLLRNRTVQASPAARADLLAGRVDPRLLANLSVLSSQLTIKVVAFDGTPPGASSAVPQCGVQLGAATAQERSAIVAFLRAQRGAYRPALVATTVDGQDQPVVTARFDVPAPFPAP